MCCEDFDFPVGEFPPLTAADLAGSLLGKALEPLLNTEGEVFVAPAVGVDFVRPWVFRPDG